MPEHLQCPTICRHGVIVEVAADNLPQPLALFGNRLVHAPSHLLLDLLQLRPHAVGAGFRLILGSLIESFIELMSQVFMLPIFRRRTSC